jgi:quinol monooxygenase YgiN
MATLLAHIRVAEDAEQRFEDIARRLYRATLDNEPAIVRYEYWRGEDPRQYYSLLSFTDHRAFIAHQTSEHHETASPEIGAVVESIRLEWVDPIQGASPLPPTDRQDAPAGADELTQKYTRRFAAQVAEWWLALR